MVESSGCAAFGQSGRHSRIALRPPSGGDLGGRSDPLSPAFGVTAASDQSRCPCRARLVSLAAGASRVPPAAVRWQLMRAAHARAVRNRAARDDSPQPRETTVAPARCRTVTGRRLRQVMLRPRVESQIHRSSIASPSDAMSRACAFRAGPAARDGILSRAAKALPFNRNQAASWSRRSESPARRRRTAACRRAIMRFVNAQQNADRCDPSGRDPRGRPAWQPRRGIRLRVCQP